MTEAERVAWAALAERENAAVWFVDTIRHRVVVALPLQMDDHACQALHAELQEDGLHLLRQLEQLRESR